MILELPGIERDLNLNTDVKALPLLLGANKNNIQFNITLTSTVPTILSDPVVLPAASIAPTIYPLSKHILSEHIYSYILQKSYFLFKGFTLFLSVLIRVRML